VKASVKQERLKASVSEEYIKAALTTPLAQALADRIRATGPISFAEYMRECLYHPQFGYYSKPESRRFADFYTSVDVHPIFGRLLARQLAEMWDVLGRPREFYAVEAGAGTGRLAAQILDFAARELAEFYGSVRYIAVEQSVARRERHREFLRTHLENGRAISGADFPCDIPAGCIFSNELLDAFPAHRVHVERGALRELYVGFKGETFTEEPGPPTSAEIAKYFQEQQITLREGQQAEINLDACEWIMNAGRRLGRGFVMTVDYGHEAAELYNERHMRGTLLAYSAHRATEDFFECPGEQDLTTHVNFTALDLWGRRAGLARTGCVSQMAFLVALGRGNEFADLYDDGANEVERVRARLLLKSLIHPEGMGETFQVFVQHKAVAQPHLTGLAGV
jgi:SAM-dependent MidA family methyltransferase